MEEDARNLADLEQPAVLVDSKSYPAGQHSHCSSPAMDSEYWASQGKLLLGLLRG